MIKNALRWWAVMLVATVLPGLGVAGDRPEAATTNQDQAPTTNRCAGAACGHVSLNLSNASVRVYDPLLTWKNPLGQPLVVEVGDFMEVKNPVFGQDIETQQPLGAGNWSTNWNKYIRDSVELVSPTSRMVIQNSTTDTGDCKRYEVYEQPYLKLTKCTSTDQYTLVYPEGNKEVYARVSASYGGLNGNVWMLSSLVAPSGKSVTVRRGVTVGMPDNANAYFATLPASILDEDGNAAITFAYTTMNDPNTGVQLSEPLLSRICDKTSRCASLQYGFMGGVAVVKVSTDLDGVRSSYDYAYPERPIPTAPTQKTAGTTKTSSASSVGTLANAQDYYGTPYVYKVTTPHSMVVIAKVDATTGLNPGNKVAQLDHYAASKKTDGTLEYLYQTSELAVYVPGKTPYIRPVENFAPAVRPDGSLGVDNSNQHYRNVVYVDKLNWAKTGRKSYDADKQAIQNFDAGLVLNGRVYHYTHDSDSTDKRGIQLESVWVANAKALSSDGYANGLRTWYTRREVGGQYDSARYPGVAGVYAVSSSGVTQASTMLYNEQGKLTQVTDPDGYVTRYFYLADGVRLKEVCQTAADVCASGTRLQSFTYEDPNASYLPDSVRDARGNTTRFTYDSYGRMLSRTDAKGNTTKFAYNSYGLLSVTYPVKDPQGVPVVRTFKYDEYSRLSVASSTYLGEPRVVINYRDTEGTRTNQVSKLSYYKHNTTVLDHYETYEWLNGGVVTLDVHRKCIKKSDADAGACTTYTYDALRNVASYGDAKGTTKLSWLDKGRQAALTPPRGGTVSYAYNTRGLMTSRYEPGNQNYDTFAYSDFGLIEKVSNVSNGMTNRYMDYGYTVGGRLKYKRGNVTGIASTNMSDCANVSAQCDAEFTWDSIYPRLATARDRYGLVTFGYDPVDPMLKLSETRALTAAVGGGSIVRNTTYDVLGRVDSLALDGFYTRAKPGSTDVKTTLQVYKALQSDAMNRVTKWKNPVGYAWRTYAGAGNQVVDAWLNIADIDDRNAAPVNSSRNFDTAGNLTDASYYLPEGGGASGTPSIDMAMSNFSRDASAQAVAQVLKFNDPAKNLSYSFDEANQLLSITDVTDPNAPRNVESRGTDADKHVISVSPSYVAGSATSIKNVAYNVPEGMYGKISTATITYGDNRSVVQSYSYNAAGDVLSDGRYTYTWGANGKLLSKTQIDSGRKTSYGYDFADRPVHITDSEGVRKDWLEWNGAYVLQKRVSDNAQWARITYDNDGVVDHAAGTAFYRVNNAVNSPLAYVNTLTNATTIVGFTGGGQPAVTWASGQAATAAITDVGFQGMFMDGSKTGIYTQLLTLNRVYDAFSYRWLSRDPLGPLADGLAFAGNVYQAMGNNPLYKTDPLGLSSSPGSDGAEDPCSRPETRFAFHRYLDETTFRERNNFRYESLRDFNAATMRLVAKTYGGLFLTGAAIYHAYGFPGAVAAVGLFASGPVAPFATFVIGVGVMGVTLAVSEAASGYFYKPYTAEELRGSSPAVAPSTLGIDGNYNDSNIY